MKNNFRKTFIVLIVLFSSTFIFSQGCSDAGFCTIDGFKPNESDSITNTNNEFKIGTSYGKGDKSVGVVGSYLEYKRKFNDRFLLTLKLTALLQSGNGLSEFGLSDVYLNGTYSILEELKLTLGAKIPLTDGNKKREYLALPMDYQSSLGTFDLIFGLAYEVKKIQFVLALQQPLTQNKNEFLAQLYPIESSIRQFQSTNKFKRSGDLLLRISYPIGLGKKWKLTPSILPIYHLKEDKYTDLYGEEQIIEDSQGLTLNGNLYVDYRLNDKHTLQASYGMPFIVRKVRPDGLTRSYLFNLEYRVNF